MTVRPEAYSVLDGARVAIGAFPELSNSVVIVGQSQGAHAAISASLLAPAYATDVHLKGTVATGVVGDPPFAPATKAPQIPTPPQVGEGFATINLLSLLAYRIIDPSLNPSDYLADAARPAFEAARTACLTDVREAVTKSNLTVENEFRKSLSLATAKAAPYQQYPTPNRGPLLSGARSQRHRQRFVGGLYSVRQEDLGGPIDRWKLPQRSASPVEELTTPADSLRNRH